MLPKATIEYVNQLDEIMIWLLENGASPKMENITLKDIYKLLELYPQGVYNITVQEV